MSPRRSCSFLVVLIYFISGCGGGPKIPPGTIVFGRIVNHGQPLELVRPEVGLGMVQITLIPADDSAIGGAGAQADKDGRFEIHGTGTGVPPKKYKLSVRHWKTGVGTKDELEDRFTPETTPIIIELPSDAVGSRYNLGDVELSDYPRMRS